MDEKFWNDMYRSRTQFWSGKPNLALVTEADGLTPGRALDVGCGEGADALWLAQRGWKVTAVDISQVALDRAAAQVASAGSGLAQPVVWTQLDLTKTSPPGAFDLVSAHYFHLPREPREAALRRLAAAVAPGGTLLVVGHHPADMKRHGSAADPSMFFTPEEVTGSLDADDWTIVVCEARERAATGHAGASHSVSDAIVRARRRG